MEDFSSFLSFCKIFTLFHLCWPVHPIPSPLIYIDAINKEQKNHLLARFPFERCCRISIWDNFHIWRWRLTRRSNNWAAYLMMRASSTMGRQFGILKIQESFHGIYTGSHKKTQLLQFSIPAALVRPYRFIPL